MVNKGHFRYIMKISEIVCNLVLAFCFGNVKVVHWLLLNYLKQLLRKFKQELFLLLKGRGKLSICRSFGSLMMFSKFNTNQRNRLYCFYSDSFSTQNIQVRIEINLCVLHLLRVKNETKKAICSLMC